MKRIHRTLIAAAVLFGGGIGAGIYVLETDVRTENERFRETENEKRLFKDRFGIVDVTGGEIMTGGATLAFAQDGGGWKITSPITWPGDRAAIDLAIHAMVGAKLEPESRIDRPKIEDLSPWGLDRPRLRLSVDTTRGRFEILVGKRNELRDLVAIADGDRSRAGLCTPDTVWPIDKPSDQFRERRLFPAGVDDVTAVKRRNRDGTGFVLEKTQAGDFEVGAPDAKTLEPANIDRSEILISTLVKRLTIGRFLTDTYDGSSAARATYGLDTSPFSISVETKEGEKTIEIGRISETQDQEGTAVAFIVGTRTVVEVPKMIQKDLLEVHSALLDRTVARFDRKKVARVELYQDQQLTVERSPDGSDWTLTAPKRAPAKVWKMDDVVRVFSKLEAIRTHDEAPTARELEDWYLDPPSRRLIFYDSANQILADVRIGKLANEGELFAMGLGAKRADVIDVRKVEILPKDAEDLVDPDRLK